MRKITLVIFLIATSISGLKVSSKICQHIQEVTVCHNVPLKKNEPLEIENCTKTLKLEPLLKEIPPGVFVKLSNLETLVLNFTLMKKIYSHSFDGLENLNELHLYFNLLSDIPTGTFHGCRNLTYLNLGANDLEHINNDVFAHLKQLKQLIISSNLLSSVPKLELPALQLLDLSRNKIKKLNKDSFNGLVSLTDLNLKGNQMFYIEKDAFKGLIKLKYLNLEKNTLDDTTEVDVENIKTDLPNLKEIRLNMNDFSCEKLKLIVEEFEKKNISIPEGLAEPGPISYHGMFCIPRNAVNLNNNRNNNV